MPPKNNLKAEAAKTHEANKRMAKQSDVPSIDAAALSLGEVSPFDAATHGPDMAHATGN